jgi:pre-mRNA-processing factor 40
MAVMKSLIKQLPITVSTRWRDARNMIIESPQFKADKSLQTIDDIDILEIYDDYSSSLIREHAENMRKAQSEKARRARKARDGFRELLADLEAKGEITSRMKWKEFVKLVEDSEAYEKLLGMPGSNPLDLFRDVVDDIAEAVAEAIKRVNTASERSGKKIELGMSREEFDAFLEENKLSSVIDPKRVSEVYEIVSTASDG